MDIVISVKHYEYDKFIHHSKTNKIDFKYFDEYEGLYYYDIPRKLSMLRVNDTVYFYLYGHIKYYAKISMIQLKIIPPNSIRIYFKKLELNNNSEEEPFLIKPFNGIKYFHKYNKLKNENEQTMEDELN